MVLKLPLQSPKEVLKGLKLYDGPKILPVVLSDYTYATPSNPNPIFYDQQNYSLIKLSVWTMSNNLNPDVTYRLESFVNADIPNQNLASSESTSSLFFIVENTLYIEILDIPELKWPYNNGNSSHDFVVCIIYVEEPLRIAYVKEQSRGPPPHGRTSAQLR
jgi:hypothetical protein